MNINFQTVAGQKSSPNPMLTGMEAKGGVKTYVGKSGSVESTTFVADLDTSIFSNDAYAQHARSTEEISGLAQNTDVLTQHNYMALLSNTMSEEDFAQACRDGFDIKNTDSAETVTILDKIKSVLLESGTVITGYNDDMSIDKLARITGSESFARELQDSFHENDIPVTAESAKSAGIAYKEISELQGLDDSAVKYLVLNNMPATIENIYFAAHSTNGQNVSGRGFYAQETGGYYAQKADNIDWGQLDSQITRIINEAGLDQNDESVKEEAKWTVEQGIPLTAENLVNVDKIKNISFPISEELGAKAIAAAIADGRKPTAANLSDPSSNYEKAQQIKDDYNAVTDDNLKQVILTGKELNLNNMLLARSQVSSENTAVVESQDVRLVQARIQLEEVRLQMTVEANKQLLDSGFSIDTAPMEDLIKRLKAIMGNMGEESAGNAVDEITGVTPENRTIVMRATLSRVSVIMNGPIEVSGTLSSMESVTLGEIGETSARLAERYKKAGTEYETMMTKPRSDLGDSIRKAFRNADDILEDMGLEANEDNRRAVRILGYNSMEISKENFENVRAFDQMLKTTLERLKPGAVLDLVRQGQNPLNMTLEEIGRNLDQNLNGNGEGGNKGGKNSDEKYSKFIYKLEHKKEITQEEKASFIGIYRLFHTLKTNDYRAIGSVLKSGMDMTLGNLLTATRSDSTTRRGMDYTVDDSFGGLETRENSSGLKIDEQISSAFKYYRTKADIVYENLEPEKLLFANPDEGTLLPELAQKLQDADVDDHLERQYVREQIRQIRDTASLRDAEPAVEELSALGAEVTYSNIEAMISNRRDRRTEGIWQKTLDYAKDVAEEEQNLLVDALDEEGYEDTYRSSLQNFSDKLQNILMSENDTYIDVRSISLIQKQLSVMSYSSEKGSFDVPVEIDGQRISMHITLKRDEGVDSRMEASVQTFEYGVVTAILSEKNNVISGMLTTTNGQSSEETEYLEGVRSKMCALLAEKLKDFGVGQDKIAILYHAQTQPISVGNTNATATDGNSKNITETRTLLTMAKAFIEAL